MRKILTDLLVKGDVTADNLSLTKADSKIAINGINLSFPNTIAEGDKFATEKYVDTAVGNITLTAGDGINVNDKEISVDNSVVRTSASAVQTLAGTYTFSNPVTVADAAAQTQAPNKGQVEGWINTAVEGVTVTGGNGITVTDKTNIAIDPAVVPQLGTSNTFTGVVTFTQTIQGTATGLDGLTASVDSLNLVDISGDKTLTTLLSEKQGNLTFSDGVKVEGSNVEVDGTVVALLGQANTFTKPITLGAGAAPTADAHVVSKKYVDDKINVGVFNANDTVKTASQKSIADYVTTQLAGEMSFKDVFDASAATDFSGLSFPAKAGDFYVVSGLSGEKTIGGLALENNDLIIFRSDVDTFAQLVVSDNLRLVENADATIVRTTGAQTINGVKTFESAPSIKTATGYSEAATKEYVDGAVSGATLTASTGITISDDNKISVTGYDSIVKESGDFDLAGKITVITPTAPTEVANKQYVDDGLSGKQDTLTASNGVSLVGNALSVDNTVIRTTGDQSLAGTKTFTGSIVVPTAELTDTTKAANVSLVKSAIAADNAARKVVKTNGASDFVASGDGKTKSWTISHTLNTSDVAVVVKEAASNQIVWTDVTVASASSVVVTVNSTVATDAGAYSVAISAL